MGEINQHCINSKKAEALSGNGNGAREAGGKQSECSIKEYKVCVELDTQLGFREIAYINISWGLTCARLWISIQIRILRLRDRVANTLMITFQWQNEGSNLSFSNCQERGLR